MALNFELALTNSTDMFKVISFEGLEFPITITPTIHGEPLLTTQALYYANRLESAVRIRFEDPQTMPKHNSREELERRFEYIIDNYLFEYSKRHPEGRLTSKITDLKYWQNDGHSYLGYDENNTIALTLDALNDESIIEISNEDNPNKSYWNDWCLIKNYTDEYIDTYVKSMKSLLNKKVKVITREHDELGTGEFNLPIVKVDRSILTYHQVTMFELLQPGRIKEKDGMAYLSRGFKSDDNFTIPLEKIKTEKYYDADLLSYYFAGVREHLPISKFRCYYNVLEYFFEDAPQKLGETAKNEREMISCVVRYFAASYPLEAFIKSKGTNYSNDIQKELISSSGVKITALNISPSNLKQNISGWLYDIRCAIVHSKKTRKGNIESRFVPYTNDEKLVDLAVPILQQLAILCIEQDGEVMASLKNSNTNCL